VPRQIVLKSGLLLANLRDNALDERQRRARTARRSQRWPLRCSRGAPNAYDGQVLAPAVKEEEEARRQAVEPLFGRTPDLDDLGGSSNIPVPLDDFDDLPDAVVPPRTPEELMRRVNGSSPGSPTGGFPRTWPAR
jgi:hypothetical protein